MPEDDPLVGEETAGMFFFCSDWLIRLTQQDRTNHRIPRSAHYRYCMDTQIPGIYRDAQEGGNITDWRMGSRLIDNSYSRKKSWRVQEQEE